MHRRSRIISKTALPKAALSHIQFDGLNCRFDRAFLLKWWLLKNGALAHHQCGARAAQWPSSRAQGLEADPGHSAASPVQQAARILVLCAGIRRR
jgi:hypothetical protein